MFAGALIVGAFLSPMRERPQYEQPPLIISTSIDKPALSNYVCE
jgi:hypothetical protein